MFTKIVSFFDPPVVLDCSVTPIPGSGSSPLQVIASLASYSEFVKFVNSTGQYIGIYSGPAGSEVLVGEISGTEGVNTLKDDLSKNSRVGLRSLGTSAITSGSVMCSFKVRKS